MKYDTGINIRTSIIKMVFVLLTFWHNHYYLKNYSEYNNFYKKVVISDIGKVQIAEEAFI